MGCWRGGRTEDIVWEATGLQMSLEVIMPPCESGTRGDQMSLGDSQRGKKKGSDGKLIGECG